MIDKLEFYKKLLAKLYKIQKGEMTLYFYIKEVSNKVEKLSHPNVINTVCDCMKFPRPLIIKDGEIYCTKCNAFI